MYRWGKVLKMNHNLWPKHLKLKNSSNSMWINRNRDMIIAHTCTTHILKKKVTLLYPERNWNIYSFKNYFLDINTELSIHSSLKVSKEKKWFHSNKLSTICSGIRITSKGTRKLMHIHEFFWKEQILHVRQCHWRANPRQKHSLRTAPWTCCRL